MEVLVNDLGTASFTYTAPQNTVSLVYSVYDNTNDEYIQYEEVAMQPDLGTTVTITIATPAVITQTGHEYLTGDAVKFSTTGALPTGLSANTVYYVASPTANTFNVSSTYENAVAGTKINTTGSQSGVHKVLEQGKSSYTIDLNKDVSKYDRSLVIEIQSIQVNGYSTDDVDVTIKRPYATATEIGNYFQVSAGTANLLEGYSSDFIEKLERKARYLINAYINSEFKFEYKQFVVNSVKCFR